MKLAILLIINIIFCSNSFSSDTTVNAINSLIHEGLTLAKKNDKTGIGKLISKHIDSKGIISRVVDKSLTMLTDIEKNNIKDKILNRFKEKMAKIYATDSKVRIFANFKFLRSTTTRSDNFGEWIKTEFENNSGSKASIGWCVCSTNPLLITRIKIDGIDMEPVFIDEFKARIKKVSNNPSEFVKQYLKN